MSRFFVDAAAVKDSIIEITDRGDIRHICRVLRLRPGDEIEVSDSVEYEYRAALSELSEELVTARILDKQRFRGEPSLRVTLYQAVPKQGKMEVIVQKTVELGVARVVPVFTARTVVVDKGGFGKKTERWQKVADEAVKQCGRGLAPEVAGALSFAEMLKELKAGPYDLVIFLYENEEETSIKEVLREYLSGLAGGAVGSKVALIVGPEGGFSEAEAEALKARAASATLGKTILRTETAGMAALAMVMYELEL